jgi:hypothetical protein
MATPSDARATQSRGRDSNKELILKILSDC